MRVKVRNTAAGPWGVIMAGHVGTVPDVVGAAMVKARAAELADDPVPVEAARELPAETATADPAQEQAAFEPPKRRRKHAEV